MAAPPRRLYLASSTRSRSYGGDVGQYRGDVGRYTGDTWEIQGRYRGDTGEMQRRSLSMSTPKAARVCDRSSWLGFGFGLGVGVGVGVALTLPLPLT